MLKIYSSILGRSLVIDPTLPDKTYIIQLWTLGDPYITHDDVGNELYEAFALDIQGNAYLLTYGILTNQVEDKHLYWDKFEITKI